MAQLSCCPAQLFPQVLLWRRRELGTLQRSGASLGLESRHRPSPIGRCHAHCSRWRGLFTDGESRRNRHSQDRDARAQSVLAGQETFKNCGNCEKCIRTQLNFLAAGVSHAPCFDFAFDTGNIASIPLPSDVQYAELLSIYKYAETHGVTGDWMSMLRARLDAYRPPRQWPKLLEKCKRKARSIIRHMSRAA